MIITVINTHEIERIEKVGFYEIKYQIYLLAKWKKKKNGLEYLFERTY